MGTRIYSINSNTYPFGTSFWNINRVNNQNKIIRPKFGLGGKIVIGVLVVLSLITVVGGSIYSFNRMSFYNNEIRGSLNNSLKKTEENIKNKNEKFTESKDDYIKGYSKEEILKYSIGILREQGKTDDQIKKELMEKFNINEDIIDELIQATKNDISNNEL